MSSSALITGGIGTPGSVALLITLGLTSGEDVVDIEFDSFWSGVQTDASAIITADGGQVRITTGSGASLVYVFWENLSLVGGEQEGPYMWIASADIPTGFTQGNLVRKGTTDYTVVHREPDGHGLERVTLQAGY